MNQAKTQLLISCFLLTILFLSACAPSQPELDVIVTQSSATVFATNTTDALSPSLTPTPSADFSSAIAMDSELAEAYALRGEVIWRSSTNYDDALVNLDKSIELDPSKELYYVTRGIIWDMKGEYEEAISDYNRAIELNPEFVYAFSHRGITYRDHGEYKKALQDFDMAIELNPADARAYYNRGTGYQYLGDFEVINEYDDAALADYNAAIADYDTAIEKDEEYEWAYFYKGQVLQILKRYDEAILEYSNVLELNPLNPDAYKWRGYCFMVLGDFQSAVDDLQSSLDILPVQYDGTVFYFLGIIYTNIDQTEEAIESFEQALTLPLGLYQAQEVNYTLMELMEDKGFPWFGQPICSRDTDGDFDPDLLTTEFITDDPFGYVEFPYQNMVEGTSWNYIWTSEDGMIYETAGKWDDSISGLHITYFAAPSFGPGKWIYSLYLEDNLVREIECRVVEP
ncbi:MAG: tetratricopeptide repeat protein [Promethearchaeota archaeon]